MTTHRALSGIPSLGAQRQRLRAALEALIPVDVEA